MLIFGGLDAGVTLKPQVAAGKYLIIKLEEHIQYTVVSHKVGLNILEDEMPCMGSVTCISMSAFWFEESRIVSDLNLQRYCDH